jgi:hypothetical protein
MSADTSEIQFQIQHALTTTRYRERKRKRKRKRKREREREGEREGKRERERERERERKRERPPPKLYKFPLAAFGRSVKMCSAGVPLPNMAASLLSCIRESVKISRARLGVHTFQFLDSIRGCSCMRRGRRFLDRCEVRKTDESSLKSGAKKQKK